MYYILAKECKNKNAWYTCYKCGKCGRVFEYGYLIDDGGTTIPYIRLVHMESTECAEVTTRRTTWKQQK